MVDDDVVEIADAAVAAESVADLALVLRALRRREARRRRVRALTYKQLARQTGWSLAVVGEYFTGVRLASVERFDELVRLLGASPVEQGVLASARERAAASRGKDEPGAVDPSGVPRMLPPQVLGFVGRVEHLADLEAMVAASEQVGTVVISALAGMGGVGKTALAVHWAHRAAASFPGGQLYVNLRGYDPAEPLTTVQALGVLLAGLGVAPAETPVNLAGRQALYRRMLVRRRALVVLDNASAVEQVRPLLPPAGCVAVVTSRDDLAELVTSDGARRISLDVLPEAEAVALLRLLVGDRADGDPDAVLALARLCGHLPLALRVAAEHASVRPGVPLHELVRELPHHPDAAGLEPFETSGDERADVREVFSWSLRRLPAPAARAFRLLGLVPGGDVDAYGLAALAGVDLAEGGLLADTLVGAHLVQSDGHGRFSMHDLLRAYAIESAERELDGDDRHGAVSRLLDFYLSTAAVAVDTQYPYGKPSRPRNRPTSVWDGATPDARTVRSAALWLAAERDNLVRACGYAARTGWPGHAVALAAVLRPFFDNGHDHDGLTAHTEALRAARALGAACDPHDHAFIFFSLSITNWDMGRLEVAADYAQQALDEYTQLDDAEGITLSLTALSLVRDAQGRYQEAIDCKLRGLRIAQATGNRIHEASQLNNLGWVHVRLEQYEAAAGFYQRMRAVYEKLGHSLGVAEAQHGIATAYAGLGRHDQALMLAEEAHIVELEYGRLLHRSEVMMTIGSIYHKQGRLTQAIAQLVDALAVARDANNPAMTALVLNALGEACTNDHVHALEYHGEALELAERCDRREAARALVGLGDAHAGLGNSQQATSHWRQALDAYTEMNLPAAARIRTRLSMSSES